MDPSSVRRGPPRWADALALVALVCLVAATYFSPEFLGATADEYHSIWPAQRLLRGDLPYVDLHTHRPPLDLLSNAAAQLVAGSTLRTSRLLQLLSCAALALVLRALFLQWGARRWEAFCAALLPVAISFPFWPVPSAHHQSLPFAFAALLLLERALARERAGEPQSAGLLLGAGALGGVAGLVIQTEGTLMALWLFLRCATLPGRLRRGAWVAAGMGGVAALVGLGLALAGCLRAGLYWFMYFPIRHYNVSGSFNDVNLAESFLLEFGLSLNSQGLGKVLILFAGALVLLAALGAVAWRVYRRPRARELAALVSALLVLWVFHRGRNDWIHLTYFLPFLLALLVEQGVAAPRSPRLRRLLQVTLVSCLGAGLVLLLHVWRVGIGPLEGFRVDAAPRAQAERLLSLVPEPQRGDPALGLPFNGMVSFFHDAPAAPYDWVLLPNEGYHRDVDYERIVAWMERHPPALVLLQLPMGIGFVRHASPLQAKLIADYELIGPYDGHVVLARRDLAEAVRAELQRRRSRR